MSVKTTRVPRPRGELDPADLRAIRKALAARDKADEGVRAAVLAAMDHGASFRVLAEATGIAGTTIQRWKNER